MVYLNRIYTKSGDAGETSLGDGTRVPKTHLRIIAYGGIDELNSVIGVALTVDLSSAGLPDEVIRQLRRIQNDLFDLGADLCVPESARSTEPRPLRVTAAQTQWLEGCIDAVNETLKPLESFVLPGGSAAAAHLHHARTVCRRVEIDVHLLAEQDAINPNVAVYLNRLSDLLFVLARASNNHGEDDVLWVPGQSRRDD